MRAGLVLVAKGRAAPSLTAGKVAVSVAAAVAVAKGVAVAAGATVTADVAGAAGAATV